MFNYICCYSTQEALNYTIHFMLQETIPLFVYLHTRFSYHQPIETNFNCNTEHILRAKGIRYTIFIVRIVKSYVG